MDVNAGKRKRGMADMHDMEAMHDATPTALLEALHAEQPYIRTAAAMHLQQWLSVSVNAALLKQLGKETCLYTRMAICDSLAKGDKDTAKQMTAFLGVIGNNQHTQLPDAVSAKKSFPLPRDIIARTLGKMDVSVYPVLIEVLHSCAFDKIREVLDAIGYMTFYHTELVTEENLTEILNVMSRCHAQDIILWKAVLCLSAFPLPRSMQALEGFLGREDILKKEAMRGLSLLKRI